jgi:hypothetical protein
LPSANLMASSCFFNTVAFASSARITPSLIVPILLRCLLGSEGREHLWWEGPSRHSMSHHWWQPRVAPPTWPAWGAPNSCSSCDLASAMNHRFTDNSLEDQQAPALQLLLARGQRLGVAGHLSRQLSRTLALIPIVGQTSDYRLEEPTRDELEKS